MAAADYVSAVQQLYIAYFGRPADVGGLADFTAQLNALGVTATAKGISDAYSTNATVKTLVDQFGTSAESAALYGSGTTESFVFQIYDNVLNRVPDAEGFAFWVNAINSGSLTRGNAAMSIMAGALANTSAQGLLDAQLINARTTVATSFTNTITSGGYTYSGDAAAATARAMLDTVVATTDTTAFQSTITSTLATITNPNAGSTFTLTTAANAFTGTSGNDTFDASTTADTLGADTLIDASTTDNDTLSIMTTVGTAIAPTTVANVETVNLTGKYGSAALNMATITGAKTLNLDSAIAAGSATITNANVATINLGTKLASATITGGATTAGATVNAGTSATSVTVNDGSATVAETYSVVMGKAGTVTLNGANANGTNTFNATLVNGSNTVVATGGTGTDTFTLNLNGGTTALTGSAAIETLNIASAGAANTVNLTTALVKTVSGKVVLTGDQNITIGGLDANVVTGITITDSTTAGTTTLKVSNAGAVAADLSKVGTDVIEFAAATNNTAIVTLNDAQTVKWSDGTASVKLAATAATDTLNITANAAAVKFEKSGTTEFATVKVTSDRATATTVTAVMDETKTTLNVLGSGNVTIDGASVAKAVDSSAATGKLTVGIDADIQKVTTGSGGSAVTLADVDPSGNYTFIGGSGNDVVQIAGFGTFDTTGTNTLAIDAGAGGTDVLQLITGASDFTTTAGMKDAVITGFEQIDVNGQSLTFTQKQLFTNGNFTLNDTAGGGAFVVTMNTDASTVVDLSGVSFTGGVAAPTVTVNGAAGVINTITGTAVADTIIGDNKADVLAGGAGNDSITGKAGGDAINVGTGTDTVLYTAAAETFEGVVTSGTTVLTGVDVISGMGAGDKLSMYAAATVAGTTAVGTALLTAAGVTDAVALVRGNYDAATGIFTTSATGADSLYQWDSNGTTAAGTIENIVLVGFTGTAAAGVNLITLA